MSSEYGWKITKDFWSEKYSKDKSTVGTMGPGGMDLSILEGKVYTFRMYTDDMGLICEGISSEKDSFNPLDDFGYGCTIIKYKNKDGNYVRL